MAVILVHDAYTMDVNSRHSQDIMLWSSELGASASISQDFCIVMAFMVQMRIMFIHMRKLSKTCLHGYRRAE